MKSILQCINEALIKKSTRLRANKYDFIDIKNLKVGQIFYGVFIDVQGNNNKIDFCNLYNRGKINGNIPIKIISTDDLYDKGNNYLIETHIIIKDKDLYFSPLANKQNIDDNYNNKMYQLLKIASNCFIVCFISKVHAEEFISNFDDYKDELKDYIENKNLREYD